jgi:hypothetical protein
MLVTKWKWNENDFNMKKFQNWNVGCAAFEERFCFDRFFTNYLVWNFAIFDECLCILRTYISILELFHIKFMFISFSLCFNQLTSRVYEIFFARKLDSFDKINEVVFPNFFRVCKFERSLVPPRLFWRLVAHFTKLRWRRNVV